jgi:hypothetical protein
MPAADISQVQVTFGNGIKREEYGPLKKAEVSIIAIVAQNADGVAALNYISKIAQDKVRELLTIQGQATATAAADASPETPAPTSEAEHPGEAQPLAAAESQRRTRRTKEQIAADAAAAAAQQSPSAEAPASTETESQAADEDEWSAAAPETVTITDAELNSACTDTSKRIGAGAPIKALISTFSPGGDAYDPDKGGRKFAVNDIAPNQRADFIAKLKRLS